MTSLQPISLSESERAELLALIHRGKSSARIVLRAHILLNASEGWRDHQIIAAFHVSRETVSRETVSRETVSRVRARLLAVSAG